MNTVKQNVASGSNVSFRELLDEYRLSLEAMNRSPKTISWYMEIMRRYFAFLNSNSLLKSVQQLGTLEARAYVLYLQGATRWANKPNMKKATGKLSPHSVQGHVRAIKAFWSWLENEGYVETNCLAKFPLPKVPDSPVKILGTEEIKRLLACVDRLTPIGAKYYTILLLLIDTGIRISELVHITIKDLELEHDCVLVLGKGQKWRSVPMSKPTIKEIKRYVYHFRERICPIESPYVFARADGEPISVNSVQQFLRRLAAKAGLNEKKCSPHIFRHSFATHAIANGANVFVLRDIMGHSSLTTTLKYTHLQPRDLQIQHAKFSPVANLGIDKASRSGTIREWDSGL